MATQQQLPNDPGFGIKVGTATGRILNRNGSLNIRRFGGHDLFADVYHLTIDSSWTRFFLVTVLTYVIVNFLFAFAYLAIGVDGIMNADTDSTLTDFSNAVFFSAQTLTTVGYGNLAPKGVAVSIIASAEALVGLLMFGLVTGISFARFSRVRPRILFATEAVIAPYRDGRNALMVRLVNGRDSVIMDANATIMMVTQETVTQQRDRRYEDLKLTVPAIQSLALNWTLVHVIEEDSPLWGATEGHLQNISVELLVILRAFDDTVGQTFYARCSYRSEEVLVGHKYVPMFGGGPDGRLELHVDHVARTEPAALFPWTSSSAGEA
jgi:inward rectifier potassium channel